MIKMIEMIKMITMIQMINIINIFKMNIFGIFLNDQFPQNCVVPCITTKHKKIFFVLIIIPKKNWNTTKKLVKCLISLIVRKIPLVLKNKKNHIDSWLFWIPSFCKFQKLPQSALAPLVTFSRAITNGPQWIQVNPTESQWIQMYPN